MIGKKRTNLSATEVVGLGEALFDCFTDRQALGGAPVNVAVHAAALLGRLGGRATVATRVGDDELGDRFRREVAQRGVSLEGVSIDEELPTGRVDVTLDEHGDASYRFEDPSAWDALRCDDAWLTIAKRCGSVAFGSLAQRHQASREEIHQFLQGAPQAIRLFDVNLRQSHYSAEVLDTSLRLASAAKLSEEELRVVGGLLGFRSDSHEAGLAELEKRYGLDWIALTRGAAGTSLLTKGTFHAGEAVAFPLEPGADTVGAGDACCAGLLVGFLLGWPVERTLGLANRLGAWVATRPGATPALPDDLLRAVKVSAD